LKFYEQGEKIMNVNVNVKRKYKINGTEYQSIDAMPQDIGQLYEKVLKAAETGNAPANLITTGDVNDMLAGTKNYGTTSIGNMGNPAKIEPAAFSPRRLIIGILLIALIIILYFVFQGK
jgi:hypothetical protein